MQHEPAPFAAMGLHADLLAELRALRRPDGGFPTRPGGGSELEPTTIAGLALGGDSGATAWLRQRQRPDGGFDEPDGRADGPTSAALAALVLEGAAARRALDFAVAHRALPLPDARDPERRGWGGRPTPARSWSRPRACLSRPSG